MANSQRWRRLVSRIAACPLPRGFAYVLEEPILDQGRFGETVAVNRGMRVRAFDSLEAARGWLEVTS